MLEVALMDPFAEVAEEGAFTALEHLQVSHSPELVVHQFASLVAIS